MPATPRARSESTAVTLVPLVRAQLVIPIQGITPVIPHKWSEKSLRMMQEKQSGPLTRPKREPKDPAEEAEASLYRLADGRPGLPATAFKAAMVSAARLFEGVTMVMLKTCLFVEGQGTDQLVPIEGEMSMRMDTPRNATGNADLRYRYQFSDWSALLVVQFLPSMIDPSSVVTLVDAAGNGGVGDWRPSAPKSSTGVYGRFSVAPHFEA